jgi:hypothetical protein
VASIKIRDLTGLLCGGRAESSNSVIDFFLRQVLIVWPSPLVIPSAFVRNQNGKKSKHSPSLPPYTHPVIAEPA